MLKVTSEFKQKITNISFNITLLILAALFGISAYYSNMLYIPTAMAFGDDPNLNQNFVPIGLMACLILIACYPISYVLSLFLAYRYRKENKKLKAIISMFLPCVILLVFTITYSIFAFLCTHKWYA